MYSCLMIPTTQRCSRMTMAADGGTRLLRALDQSGINCGARSNRVVGNCVEAQHRPTEKGAGTSYVVTYRRCKMKGRCGLSCTWTVALLKEQWKLESSSTDAIRVNGCLFRLEKPQTAKTRIHSSRRSGQACSILGTSICSLRKVGRLCSRSGRWAL